MNVDPEKISKAIALLRDENLVWSFDFEIIREPLKKLLLTLIPLGSSGSGNLPLQLEISEQALNELLEALVREI
jgi:hypothetical protein